LDGVARTARAEEVHRRRAPGPGVMHALPGLAYQCRLDDAWTMDFVSPGALKFASSPGGKETRLAIVDLVLKGESGVRLAEELRESLPDCRILFTSGYPRHSLVDQGLLDRGSPFMEKPFTPRNLLEQVRATLDGTDPTTAE
jgi:CheY-like chemotaxis protein